MNKSILVIDDEEAVRKSFALALEKTEYEVETAENGKIGLDRFGQEKFDLVFLDLKMPGMSGVETLLKIREKDSVVPVYIVTAFHKEFLEQLADARKQEIDFELLIKPLGLAQIREIVGAILEGGVHVQVETLHHRPHTTIPGACQ